MRWIKWYAVDWINSTARDEMSTEERGTFVDFVCLAAFPGTPLGTFKFSSWEALSRKLNTPLTVILTTRDKCLKANRITLGSDEEGIWLTINNWGKYQTERGVDKISTNGEKVLTKFLPRRDIDIEKRREEVEGLPPQTPEMDATEGERKALKELRGITNWPFDFKKDLDYLRKLQVDFPGVDVLGQVPGFSVYQLDHPIPRNKGSPRLRLRYWMQKAGEFAKRGEPYGQRQGIRKLGGDSQRLPTTEERRRSWGVDPNTGVR